MKLSARVFNIKFHWSFTHLIYFIGLRLALIDLTMKNQAENLTLRGCT